MSMWNLTPSHYQTLPIQNTCIVDIAVSEEEEENLRQWQHDVARQTRAQPNILQTPRRDPDAVYVAFFKHIDEGASITDNCCCCLCCCCCIDGCSRDTERRKKKKRPPMHHRCCNTLVFGPMNVVIEKWGRFVSPKYSHCQFAFVWNNNGGDDTIVSFGTNKELPSTYTAPRYTNCNQWTVYPIPSANTLDCSGAACRRNLWAWCQRNQSVSFNHIGYIINFLPHALCLPWCTYDAGGSSYFCAEQVAAAMQCVSVPEAKHLTPRTSTPDHIRLCLKNHGAVRSVLRMPDIIYNTTATNNNNNNAPSATMNFSSHMLV